jgi:hypothetical protein
MREQQLYNLACHSGEPEEVSYARSTTPRIKIQSRRPSARSSPFMESAFPLRWIDGLLGRTVESDAGRVFELIGRRTPSQNAGAVTSQRSDAGTMT